MHARPRGERLDALVNASVPGGLRMARRRRYGTAHCGARRTRPDPRDPVSDTLVDALGRRAIEVVVAHEIAHHVHGDVWRAASASRCRSRSRSRRWSPCASARRAARPVYPAIPAVTLAPPDLLPWLPVLAAAVLIAHRVLEPIGLALSRRRELRAERLCRPRDRRGRRLRHVDAPPGADESRRRSAAAPRKAAVPSHPPVRDRVLAALRHAERAAGTRKRPAGSLAVRGERARHATGDTSRPVGVARPVERRT